jgi:3-phenylpropionate/trans-cinnamate dioxygenase ferredoxin component
VIEYFDIDPENCEFILIGKKSDLPPGKRLFIDVDGEPIVIFNIAGELFAVADICSHDNNPLGEGELDEFEIICPRHGAHFDVRNGKALSLPAVVDIPSYPVRIEEDEIWIGLP